MGKSLRESLEDLKKKLEGLGASHEKTKRYIREIDELTGLLNNINVKKELEKEYESLIEKAKELNQGENYRNIKKMDSFIPRCFRFYYDNLGELSGMVKQLAYSFMATSLLFYLVSLPTYITIPLLPIIFIAPMYVGIKGIQKTSARNMIVGLVLPNFAVLTGMIGVFNAITASKFNIFVVLYALASVALIAAASYNLWIYKKYKKIFS